MSCVRPKIVFPSRPPPWKQLLILLELSLVIFMVYKRYITFTIGYVISYRFDQRFQMHSRVLRKRYIYMSVCPLVLNDFYAQKKKSISIFHRYTNIFIEVIVSTFRSICPSFCRSVCPSLGSSVRPLARLSVRLWIRLSV